MDKETGEKTGNETDSEANGEEGVHTPCPWGPERMETEARLWLSRMTSFRSGLVRPVFS